MLGGIRVVVTCVCTDAFLFFFMCVGVLLFFVYFLVPALGIH